MDIQQLKSSKILLLGELCLDKYLFGTADRISPEAPVPVVKINEWKEKEGMGGNVKSNLTALGNEVTFLHNEEPIQKTRIIDSRYHQQLFRLDREDTPVAKLNVNSLPDFKDFDAIVISDYDKGFLPLHVLVDISDKAYAHNVKLFIDTKKNYLNGITGAYIKLNEFEYEALSHKDKRNKYVVTLGDKGTKYENTIYPVEKVDMFDPTGAGDTFLAAFVSYFLGTEDMGKAIMFANKWASVAVTKLGCYSIRPEDIDE